MEAASGRVRSYLTALDNGRTAADEQEFLYRVLAAACVCFNELLLVHPYLDGNGHMARAIVWLFVGRYGYIPDGWPVDPRPETLLYMRGIDHFRRNIPETLIHTIAKTLKKVRSVT